MYGGAGPVWRESVHNGAVDEQRPSAVYSAALWLIAAGLVLVGYGAWERWGTNVVAWHNQQEAVADLTDGWRDPDDAKIGQAMALLRIPALGADYEVPIVEGVNSDDLSRGVGHYPRTALPGEVGNFAVAGHRVTHGEPFRDLPRLAPGDIIEVETSEAIYTYAFDNDPGDLVVQPDDTWVLDPVPPGTLYDEGEAEPTQAIVTLTTCGKLIHTSDRIVAFGHLVDTEWK
jgi:sortase A